MRFRDHSALADSHAFLSPSNNAWSNYDDDKLLTVYRNRMEAARGVELHNFAAMAIRLGRRMPRNQETVNAYVNDAIGYKMEPEQVLFYSFNAYGTADAIAFNGSLLRIHDLKTGITKVSMRQLEVYTALFCLEYDIRPGDIEVELRIYQLDGILVHRPELDIIAHIMDRIVTFDKLIESEKAV